jgi:hypothetical protein
MNRDDVIRMAREAGLHIATDHDWMPIIALAYAQKFAELVATAEREACAKVCMDKWMEWMDASPDKRLDMRNDAEDCAFAIRERGAP